MIMLISITGLKQCLLGLSTVKFPLFIHFPYYSLWKAVTMHTPHLMSGELCSPFFRVKYPYNLFIIFFIGDLSFINLFNNLFV